jgi:hypothetical protein
MPCHLCTGISQLSDPEPAGMGAPFFLFTYFFTYYQLNQPATILPNLVECAIELNLLPEFCTELAVCEESRNFISTLFALASNDTWCSDLSSGQHPQQSVSLVLTFFDVFSTSYNPCKKIFA